jgi:hypothetical protein
MSNVLIFSVERVEESETTMIDWLSWSEKIRMIIEFNSKACLFVEDSINSEIDRFEISTKDDSSRFFLI